MGRAAPAEGYRDDPDAVSMHTTPDDYTYDDAPEISGLPPSYEDSESGSSAPVTIAVPNIRHVPPPTTRTNHDNPSFKNGKPVVCDTLTHMDSKLDSNPELLENAIRTFANDPPMPYIYIMGTHKETVKRGDKKETQHVTDFRIVINMQRYLHGAFGTHYLPSTFVSTVENSEKTHRGTILKCRAPGSTQDIEISSPPPTLTEWCHRYCASPRMLRIFRLRRTIPGFDQTYLKNRLEGLIASTNYRGNVTITFPVEDANLDIYTSNTINRWRLKTWIRWIFYLSFLWIFTWPYLFFMTKRYAVAKAEWPFSTINEDGSKKYTTISEEQWFAKWHVAVRRLVLDRFQGEAGEEMMMGVASRAEDPPMPGRTGHEGIDNAMGVLTQGFQVARAISSGNIGDVGRGVQGGWGYDT